VSVKQFLKQRAVNVVVDGHYTLSNWYDPEGKPRTFTCRTSRVSPFRMIVEVPVVAKVGERITSYFGDFGKLDGAVSDTLSGGFLIELAMTPPMREKLANKLIWLEQKQKDPCINDGRQHPRIIPARSHSILTFIDGATTSCSVIDMSVSGVAVSADVQPPIGTPLAIGAGVGRVIRHLHGGFAVKFAELQSSYDLERLIIRSAPLRSTNSPQLQPCAQGGAGIVAMATGAPPQEIPQDTPWVFDEPTIVVDADKACETDGAEDWAFEVDA
jgi:hypothetical protein